MATLRIFDVAVLAGTQTNPPAKLRIMRVSVEHLDPIIPQIQTQTVESRVTVTMTATFDGAVTDWTWTQTSGPTVTLSGTGDTRTFVAPILVDGAALTFSVAAITGEPTVPGTATVNVLPHRWWFKVSGGFIPLGNPLQKTAAWSLFPNTGSRPDTGVILRQ